MNDGTWIIMLAIFLLPVVVAIAVYADARSLQSQGVPISPLLWAIFAVTPPFIGMVIYAVMRRTKWKPPQAGDSVPHNEPDKQ